VCCLVSCRQPQTSASCRRSQWRCRTTCCTSPHFTIHVKVSCRKLPNGNQPATCIVAAGRRAAAICSNWPFKVQWLLYAPLVDTAFCPHRGFVALFCIVPTNNESECVPSFNRLVSVAEKHSVYCEVGSESRNIIQMNVRPCMVRAVHQVASRRPLTVEARV
jgi:hypothetical protein